MAYADAAAPTPQQRASAGLARYAPDVLAFTEQEVERQFVPDDELFDLCRSRAGVFEPDGSVAMPMILARIHGALSERRPLSIIRVGNGEGNALGLTLGAVSSAQEVTFLDEFWHQNGGPIGLDDAIRFATDVRAALADADIIGFRSVGVDEPALIARYLDLNDAYAALGMLYARRFLYDSLREGRLAQKVLTTAWIHLDALRHLDELLGGDAPVVIITGREALRSPFEERLGPRLDEFITVPVQGTRPESVADSHLGTYPSVRARLDRDLRGTLVLVGAGLFGKVYCMDAKRNGGVCLDLGSAFDLLAGQKTRPVHARIDLDAVRWM